MGGGLITGDVVDIIDVGAGGTRIGVDIIDVGAGGTRIGVDIIDVGAGGTRIGVGTLTGLVTGTETSSPPITLTGSSANVGSTTGSLMLVGVPKLVGGGAMGVNPLDD